MLRYFLDTNGDGRSEKLLHWNATPYCFCLQDSFGHSHDFHVYFSLMKRTRHPVYHWTLKVGCYFLPVLFRNCMKYSGSLQVAMLSFNFVHRWIEKKSDERNENQLVWHKQRDHQFLNNTCYILSPVLWGATAKASKRPWRTFKAIYTDRGDALWRADQNDSLKNTTWIYTQSYYIE